MSESRFELSVGDSVRLDDQILTVLDINGDEITFRIDLADEQDPGGMLAADSLEKRFPPR
jgi:hypothetical protein